MSTVGVVVPAYRPQTGTLVEYVSALATHDRVDDVVLELDDPRPETLAAVEDLPVAVSTADRRRGKGAAITDGFERLETAVLAFADADGSTPVDSVLDVVDAVSDGADLAVGSRRHPEADVRGHQTFARRRMGDAFARVARLLLDAELYDYQCGAKAVSRSGWERLRSHLHEPGFAWDVELVAIAGALELSIAEVPVTWIDQPASTVSPVRTSLDLARSLVVSRHRARRLAGSRLHAAVPDEDSPLVDRRDDRVVDD